MQQQKNKSINRHAKAWRTPAGVCLLFCLFVCSAFGQMELPNDSLKVDPNSTVYPNISAGEFTPGKGFKLVRNQFASLNFSAYMMARYVTQTPGADTWYDHLGNAREFKGRNDIYWHRVMLWFTGHLGTPKLNYMATVWTVFTTQQTLVYGNISYTFNKHFKAAIGITPNLCIRSLQGPFPFFSSTDRTMTEDALRGGFTNGFFVTGEIVPRLNYTLMLGNNLSQLGIKAGQLTRHMSKGINLVWLPTTGEFGPRGGNGDFEEHTKLSTRFGANYCHSRENRFNNIDTPSPDNTQVRMSDGVLFFETGSLAPGVTVTEADYDMVAVDLGFKYRGLAVHTEFYNRLLSDFDADGDTPLKRINDKGYKLEVMYMAVPKILCIYGITSQIRDEFKRNPWEAGLGVNIYPYKTRSWRINAQAIHVYKAAAGGVFGLYTAGQTGMNFTIGTDILL
ncbi:hypothetical protein WBG78_09090 [Chryseolinea sp. T2]|uniref:hypothetical protein n=1 Tax=Chryseolinea sp. T2 TaxID=3129255 RepID=UPI0030769690